MTKEPRFSSWLFFFASIRDLVNSPDHVYLIREITNDLKAWITRALHARIQKIL